MTVSKAKEALFPAEVLRELFTVTECGKLIYKATGKGRRPGREAGVMGEKYLRIRIRRHNFMVHRVIYAITHGHWPDGFVDHIDNNKLNNRPDNLRVVTARGNSHNRRHPARNNKAGLLGVSSMTRSGYFRAAITVGRVKIELGYFKDPQSAHEAYVKAKRELHEECTI